MKKLFSFLLAAAMIVSVIAAVPSNASANSPDDPAFYSVPESDPAFPEQSETPFVLQDEITFSPVRSTPSSRELGIMRLREAGCSEFSIESFSDEELEQLSEAKKVIISTSYFAEVYDEDDGEASLINISYDNFIELEQQDVLEDDEQLPILLPSNATVEQGQVTPMAVQNTNGGRLKVETRLFQISNSSNSGGYCVASEFLWFKMPSYRGTDVFAITRDSGTVEVPNYHGRLQYIEKRRTYSSFGGTITATPAQSFLHTQYLSNDAPSNTGYGIRFNVPTDTNPPAYMFPNQIFVSRQYSNLCGHVHYYGYLRYPDISPQYFNHWTTYLHKKASAWGLGFSFSVSYPLGAAISIQPRFAPKFDRVNITLLAKWVKK